MRTTTTIAKQGAVLGELVTGYAEWINQPRRAASAEIGFGAWWRLDETYWRLAWIEATGELYAEELGRSDRFVLLQCSGKKEVHDLMRSWYDGDNFAAFLQRMNSARAGKPGLEDPAF